MNRKAAQVLEVVSSNKLMVPSEMQQCGQARQRLFHDSLRMVYEGLELIILILHRGYRVSPECRY